MLKMKIRESQAAALTFQKQIEQKEEIWKKE
jgi:hypothetical protein